MGCNQLGECKLEAVYRLLCKLARLMVAGTVIACVAGQAEASCRGMSVRDMISVTRFISPYYQGRGSVTVSPDGKYVSVVTQAGDLSRDEVVDEMLVWKMGDIARWIVAGDGGSRPEPFIAVAVRSPNTFQGGVVPIGLIRDVRWGMDSKEIYFRARKPGVRGFGLYRIGLGGNETLLSAPDQDVRNYDIKGREMVYEAAAATREVRARVAAKEDARPYFVGSGHTLYNLLFPKSWLGGATDWVTVWRICGGLRMRVPLTSHESEVSDDRHVLSVSPGGKFVMMDLPVKFVPSGWQRYGRSSYPVWTQVGGVSLGARNMWVPHQFTLVRLGSGKMRPAVAAPDGFSRMFVNFWLPGDHAGPLVSEAASWAPSAAAVLLSNTFLPNSDGGRSRSGGAWGATLPCLAVVSVRTSRAKCVESLGNRSRQWTLMGARWQASAPARLLLTFKSGAQLEQQSFCVHSKSTRWLRRCGSVRRLRPSAVNGRGVVRVWVEQSLNSPPRLIAALPGQVGERVLYDPNHRLRNRCIGSARTVEVSVGHRETVKIGLLLPVNYVVGREYPLVIQTHGYRPEEFLSAGVSGAFAARAFAASGIAVLQVPECPAAALNVVAPGVAVTLSGTTDELSCNIAVFRAGIRYVVAHGFVDPHELGIIGFSKTAEYVLAALEEDGTRFKAAELIDGDLNTYTQYIAQIGMSQGYINVWESAMIGAPPIGAGLALWVTRSTGFSLYKVRTPVLIQADGRQGVLEMWEAYAVLHELRRPVDLAVIQAGTHPFSNPRQRLASEGMSVDWFRFWLEHKRPTDDAEYNRWSSLRDASRGSDDASGSGNAAAVPGQARNGSLAQ